MALGSALPGAAISLIFLWTGDLTPKVQWTLTVLIVTFCLGFALALRERVVLPLQTLSNLLAALRESDFSIRARTARGPRSASDDPLGARTVAAEALAWTRRHPITSWVVTDAEAVEACVRFADDHRVLVEPACGAALAAVYGRAEPLDGRDPIVVIVCGGAGVSRRLLEQWSQAIRV